MSRQLIRPSGSELVDTIGNAMLDSPGHLVVMDAESGQWVHHPWPSIFELGTRMAGRLEDSGASNVVGVVGEVTAELIASIYGCWAAGRSVSILPGPVRGSAPDQWAAVTVRRLRTLDCDTLLSHGSTLELLRDRSEGMSLYDLQSLPGWSTAPDSIGHRIPVGAPAVMQGTAGSTGDPKTAVLSHEAVLNHFRGLSDRVGGSRDDVLCSWLPLYHDMGLMSVVCGMAMGITMWLAPTSAFARAPFEWIRWLDLSSATLTAAPNFAYNLIGKYSRRLSAVDLSALQYAINGGEPVDADGLAQFASALAPFGLDANALAPSYGLAEATCAVTASARGVGLRIDDVLQKRPASDPVRHRHALLGQPLDGVEIRIVAGERDLPELAGRDVGLVEIRGRSMMSGYLHDTVVVTADQWWPTGDVGYLIDGELVVCGRVKEVITVAGRNVFPHHIERVTALVPGVRAGAVVATMTERRSTDARPDRLVIVAEFSGKNAPGTEDRIVATVASECGVVPTRVVLVSPGTLPRTTSGKLKRLEVGAQQW
ncbi:long-chain-fatty acid--ACP ligase MbtM [Nocardia sp. BMG51109]|uniref:long-chain-fatty acid--ACP ligase MbtM n=1 Tax=Nocardia sp. BMG51109 TaxID=1056816 RepID=UPI000A024E1A|nr:long-chain-fatty acid--ACP ligase MbtM [Nocardia sp. BMG51109]